jgi:hypothetical protein
VRRLALGAEVALPRRTWFRREARAAWVFASRGDAERLPLPPGDVRGGVLEPWGERAAVAQPASPPVVVLVGDAGAAVLHGALRGLGALAPSHPDLRIVLLGTAGRDDSMRVHAGALGLGAQVVVASRRDGARWLAAATAVWVASGGDDAAYAALDAAARGIPSVMVRGTAASRVLPPGVVAEFVAPDEPLVAAAAVARWLGDSPRRAADGAAARKALPGPAASPVAVLEAAVAAARGQRTAGRPSQGAA